MMSNVFRTSSGDMIDFDHEDGDDDGSLDLRHTRGARLSRNLSPRKHFKLSLEGQFTLPSREANERIDTPQRPAKLDDHSIGSSSTDGTSFQFSRDLFGETARRLSRKFSLVATSSPNPSQVLSGLSRFFSINPGPHQEPLGDHDNGPTSDNLGKTQSVAAVTSSEKPSGKTEEHVATNQTVIQSERADESQRPMITYEDNRPQSQDFSIDDEPVRVGSKSALSRNYLLAEPSSAYFGTEEYTKRHRQSIAVRSFFTKSIEVNADEEDDLELIALHNRQDSQEHKQIGARQTSHGSNRPIANKQRTQSGEMSREFESFDRCSVTHLGNTQDDDDQTLGNDSTTSGWTATTSNALESSSERLFQVSPQQQRRPSSLASAARAGFRSIDPTTSGQRDFTEVNHDLWQTDRYHPSTNNQQDNNNNNHQRSPTTAHRHRSITIGSEHAPSISNIHRHVRSPSPVAAMQGPHNHGSKQTQERHLSIGTSNELEPSSLPMPMHDEVVIDRANSGDFSSFTLATTSTSNNRPNEHDGKRRDSLNALPPLQQRSAIQIGDVTNISSHSSLAHDQRRAFSETEVGSDERLCNLLLGSDDLQSNNANKISDANMQPLPAADPLPQNLVECYPSSIQTTATLPDRCSGFLVSRRLGRQAKSAEPSLSGPLSVVARKQGTGTTLTQHQQQQILSDHSKPSSNSSCDGAKRPVPLLTATHSIERATTATNSNSSEGRSRQLGSSVTHLINKRRASGHHSYQILDDSSSNVHHQHHYISQTPPGAPPSSQRASSILPPTNSGSPNVALARVQSQHYNIGAHHNQPALATSSSTNQPHYHQWCQSNTFSSSLNSDISTSGPTTKDTTEKDSSRRTSTLSGISSIYQQETSIGMGTPCSSYACSNSTPANTSQAGGNITGCSNMGSIPELATLEHSTHQKQDELVAYNSLTDSDVCQVHRKPAGVGASNLVEQMTTTTGKFNKNRFDSLIESSMFGHNSGGVGVGAGKLQGRPKIVETKGQSTNATIAQTTGSQMDAHIQLQGDNEQANSSSPANNIQRVAQSLRSQLRERLSGMRPLNAFMSLNFDSTAGQTAATLQTTTTQEEETNGSSTIAAAGTSYANQPSPSKLNQDQVVTSSSSVNAPLDGQMQRQSSFASGSPCNSLTAATTPTCKSSTTTRTNETQSTPTPATLKSFFRSTSSAAFNAFASSFQQQSNSSTPTATTVVAANSTSTYFNHHNSSSNSPAFNQRLGSLSSSEVFDTVPTSPLSQQQQQNRASAINRNQSQNQLNIKQEQLAPGSPRSPLSPISVTSTRFFARIRDKFYLSSTNTTNQASQQQQSATQSLRPTSSMSTSTASTTVPMNLSSTVTLLDQKAQQPPIETVSGDANPIESTRDITPTQSPANAPADYTKSKVAEIGTPRSLQQEYDENPASNSNSSVTGGFEADGEAQDGTSTSKQTTTTSTDESDHKRRQLPPNIDNKSTSHLKEAPRQSSAFINDPFQEEYERVLSSRRPSYQQHLDEQVNQIYKMAVEQKIKQQSATARGVAGHQLLSGLEAFVGSSDLDSIINPMSSLLGHHPYQQQVRPTTPSNAPSGGGTPTPYMPDGTLSGGCGTSGVGAQSQPYNPTIYRCQQQQQWMDSCQQSMESSSSIRSLRSCWFSMPELYAMNNDGSGLQSPSGSQLTQLTVSQQQNPQQQHYQAGRSSAMVDELLESLSKKLHEPGEQQDKLVVSTTQLSQSPQPPCEQTGVVPPQDWPPNQLYKQLTSQEAAHHDWSITDLTLTTDDIAPAKPRQEAASEFPAPPPKSQIPGKSKLDESNETKPESPPPNNEPSLMKYSTLDDSICVSIKSSSSHNKLLPPAEQPTNDEKGLGKQQSATSAPSPSRPVSQNSTISSTSCALSDLNSSDLLELNRSSNTSNSSPHNVSPMSLNTSATTDNDADMVADELPAPGGNCAQMVAQQTLEVTNVKQQRAMSLVPHLSLHLEQSARSGSPLVSIDCASGLQQKQSFGSTLGLPKVAPARRRSAAPNLAPDVAPAATTLDLRLAARPRRVKLTDLHPITFINDKEFLSSMSSLKNANNNRLDAIFNSPVGRRLSVNAEIAAQQQQQAPSAKSGIKIGLTGYVYIDRPESRLWPNDLTRPHFRRPSLAPNFWRQNHRPSVSPTLASDASGGNPAEQRQQHHGNQLRLDVPETRARSASYTPTLGPPISQSESAQQANELAPSMDQVASITKKERTEVARQEWARSERLQLQQQQQQQPPKLTVIVAKPVRSSPVSMAPRRRSVGGSGPHHLSSHNYHLDVRRRSMMLERLSESSIEIEAAGGQRVAPMDQPNSQHQLPEPKSPSVLATTRPRPMSPMNRTIGDKLGGRRKPQLGRSTSDSSISSSSSSSEEGDGTTTSSSNDHHKHSKTRSGGPKSPHALDAEQQSDSSSDDGDIDKLVAQYSVVGDSLHWHTPGAYTHRRQMNQMGLHSTSHRRRGELGERVIRNDMILRQLLLASKAASLTTGGAGGCAPRLAQEAATATGGNQQLQHNNSNLAMAEMRRFSAINLYQRDEDIFVANSMKRPPSSQIQILSTLPLLAGNLPVIKQQPSPSAVEPPTSCQNADEQLQAKSFGTYNQLPVLTSKQSPVKSIITGTSGLSADPMQADLAQDVSLTASTRTTQTISGVNVEEQLRRLRQQEKRSQASNLPGPPYQASCETPSSGSGSDNNNNNLDGEKSNLHVDDRKQEQHEEGPSKRSSLDAADSLKSCDLEDVLVPDDPSIPAILKPSQTDSNSIRAADLQTNKKVHELETTSSISQINFAANSLATRPVAELAPGFTPVGGSKSCEPPFSSQLDTIIEGRGLLLGSERDRAYANKLRRLSGNSHCTSLRRVSDVPSLTTSLTNYDDWCKCDLNSPPIRKLSQVLAAGQQQSSRQTRLSGAGSGNQAEVYNTEEPKSVLDTVKSLARKTLVNFVAMSGQSVEISGTEIVAANNLAPNREKLSRSNSSSSSTTSSADSQLDSTLEEEEEDENEQRRDVVTRKKSAGADQSSCSTSSSMISLDDAENYRAKNKENKKMRGRSMESSSSNTSESTLSVGHDDLKVHSEDDLEEEEEKYDEEEDKDEEEDEKPKVCYKCNKHIKMEVQLDSQEMKVGGCNFQRAFTASSCDQADADVAMMQSRAIMGGQLTSPLNINSIERGLRRYSGSSDRATAVASLSSSSSLMARGVAGSLMGPTTNLPGTLMIGASRLSSNQQQQSNMQGLSKTSGSSSGGTGGGVKHGRRRAQTARRSASMNEHSGGGSMGQPTSQASSATAGPANRRKNKWQIQRNLAPKLKRQRSFSANYQPEAPVMPPPRRFSAAPTLSCPHRNKSSSHSSSSLHRYSIDSSESMITVIPANRAGCQELQLQLKRSSHGSISCLSSQAQSPSNNSGQHPMIPLSPSSMANIPGANNNNNNNNNSHNCGNNLEQSGSLYNLQSRSPLSPRSPIRCSPAGFLTPSNTSEPQFGSITYSSSSLMDAASNTNNSSSLEQPSSPANTNTTTCSRSTAPTTVVQHQQQTMRWGSNTVGLDLVQQPQQFGGGGGGVSPSISSPNGAEFQPVSHSTTTTTIGGSSSNPMARRQQLTFNSGAEYSSLAVENGTTSNSSHNELDEFGSMSSFNDLTPDQVDDSVAPTCSTTMSPRIEQTDRNFQSSFNMFGEYDHERHNASGPRALASPTPSACDHHCASSSSRKQSNKQADTLMPPGLHLQGHRGSTAATTYDADSSIDPNQPVICATINDFCARHSREELEYLVGQIEGLKISECYYSEKSSTLCMVIEVYHCDRLE